MIQIDFQYLRDELRHDLENKDATKALIVLSHMEQLEKSQQRIILLELSRADADFVLPLLVAFSSRHPKIYQSQAMLRGLLISKAIDYPDLLLKSLCAPETENKIECVEIAGEMRLEKAVPYLVEMLMSAEDPELLKAIIDTLGLIGVSDSISVISDFLYVDNRELVVAAVRALGKIAAPSAMFRLAERVGGDHDLDKVILEVFSEVQDNTALKKLSETIASHHAHIRSLAKKLLVRIGRKSVPYVIENLRSDDVDLQINSLNVLGDIGDVSAAAPIRKLLQSEVKNANARFAAYEALSFMPAIQGAYVLAGGLTDPVEHVRIAAARAVDRNYNDVLSVGLRNMVRFKNEVSDRIVDTIILAQADKIFLDLLDEAVFQETAIEVLSRVHADVSDHYVALLKSRGYRELAEKILPEEAREARKPRACAVDDSRMILSLYKNTLHELGVEPVVFEFPASAIEWLGKEKPDIVFTDLNMPEITGIELTRRVRKIYSEKELPIIMVTTQSDAQDHEAAKAAGVSSILFKPFDKAALKRCLDKFCPPQTS
ncbi:MAG: response regulator [Syntrophobacteraceae bacterium]|nr:response regulator [Syntrophobacteraceae bacterium]